MRRQRWTKRQDYAMSTLICTGIMLVVFAATCMLTQDVSARLLYGSLALACVLVILWMIRVLQRERKIGNEKK